MSNLKQKISYKVMALFLAVLMVVSMIPATVIAYALDSAVESPYKAKNLTAVYNAATDAIDMTWDAFETAPYELWVCVDDADVEQIDVSSTTYSREESEGGQHTYSLRAYVDEEDSTGVDSAGITVQSAYTFASVPVFDTLEVDNDLTITEIVNQLPTETEVLTSEVIGLKVSGNSVQWNTESANYDQSKSEEQTITIPGVVVLNTADVQNRNNLPLVCSIEVKVNAAVDVSITSDLDDSAPVEKKVGESLALSVEATGTAPTYQWFKKTAEGTEDTAIDGATSATFTISSVSLTDAAQYYCVVTGKNETTAISKIATVNVSRNATSVDLSIDPADGQTRPKSVTLEAVGIPDDATGKLIFKEGESNILAEITLPNANKTTTFKAYGANNDYDFTVIYEAGEDNIKYLGSEKTINGYGFGKADQTVNFKNNTVPSEDITYSEGTNFTVQAEGSQTNLETKYEYAIVDEQDADGDTVSNFIASINKDTGKVTILAAGSFKITVKALSDDDYNESAVVTSDEIKVNRAEQGEFKFATGDATTTYTHNFTYKRELASTGTGNGAITYKLGDATTAIGVVVNGETGEITFTDAANDNSTNFTGKVGVVEVVATKANDKWWKSTSASYTITIEKADQSIFKFATETPAAITYTANEGTTFTNMISADDDKNGWVNVNNKPVYCIVSEKALPSDTVTTASNVVSIDSEKGTITAKRSGVVTIKATLAGNGVYNAVETTYTITVNRGTVETATNGDSEATGFNFNFADSSIKYGFNGFVNVAAGGQTDTNTKVVYTDNSDEVDVAQNGVISFNKAPADAANDTYTVTVTATKPETEKYLACSISYTLTVTRDAVNPATDFKVNGEVIKDATKLTSFDGWYNAEHANITVTPSGNYTQISENGTEWKESIERKADDNHAIAFYLKDATGNTSLISNQTVNYDKTFATAKLTVVDDNNFWDKFLETITFGLWKKESKKILVEAEDNLSGIMSIEYYEQNDNFEQYNKDNIADANIAWTMCTLKSDGLKAESTVDVELKELSNKKVVVYTKVTDYAGNVSYFRTDGMIFDSITPDQETELPKDIIKIELPGNITEGLYNGEVPFKVTVNDRQTNAVASGIKTIKVTISGSEVEEYIKEINVTSAKSEVSKFDSSNINADEFTADNTFVVPAEFDSNYLTILVEVEDYAGNKYTNENSLTHLAIDVTNPEINVAYDDQTDTFSNGKYIGNNKNREATINITELNFNNSAVVITVVQDGKTLDIQPIFTPIPDAVDENGDQVGWQMKINYATLGEGEFNFDIKYTDKATNKNNAVNYGEFSNPQNFIIDNTKPIISVEISNSEVKNDKYFADDRTATVTIIERNFSENYKFDWSGLTFTLDGVVQNAPTPKITRSDDATYERVYTIDFSVEGDYTFDVKYTDLADNLADTYSCNSVSYKDFTVDKTNPVITITGVENKTPYNRDVIAPNISYYDINAISDEITLTVIENGSDTPKKVMYKEASAQNDAHGDHSHGRKVELENITPDGIYTLTVMATDKAGRSVEEEVTFSVNRNGSIYDITSLKDNVIGKYLQHEQDVVFTETNVDPLKSETVIIKLTKNGTPTDLVKGKDYDVEPIEDKWAAWSQYKYTIHNSLFADDGRYSITVYSVDAAGNINENIDETKTAEISFGIDKTKPVIVPIDFESGVQYPVDPMKTVSVEIKDNLVLEGVKIYLNDKEIEYKVDGETYTFNIPKSNSKQDVRIVAVDAAGNEEIIEVTDFLVNANLFVRWYNNTPLFISSIAGVIVLSLGITIFLVFFKKKRKEDEDK